MKQSNVIHTPKHHIPLGEHVITEDGQHALRIKKGSEYEEITVKKLIELLFGKEIWADLINEK